MQAAIERAFLAGKWEWPSLLVVTLENYSMHVLALGTPRSELERYGTDIYLALACGLADSEASRILEQSYVPLLDEQLARSGLDKATRQDVLQQMLLHLCTGDAPRILTYGGRAALRSWLAVATQRFALNMRTQARQHSTRSSKPTIDALVCSDASPELQIDLERVRPIFQSALETAFDRLTARDKTLLRFYFLDGLTVDRIGKMYGIHRATAARWLVDIRQRILADVRMSVATDHGVQSSEFESLAFLVHSGLHLSLKRVLGAA